MLKPTLSVVLDKRVPNKDELFPIKLRATFQVSSAGGKKWVQKYYSLGKAVSAEDFKSIMGTPKNKTQRDIRVTIVEAEQKANNILKAHTFVTPEMFARLFNSKGNMTTVGSVFNLVMSEMLKAGRIGNYNLYKTTRNSVARFVDPTLQKMSTRKKEDLIEVNISFFEINADWLKRYKDFILKEAGPTTLSIYLRHLRAVYNRAIAMHIVKQDLYPFGKTGYVIKKSRSRKIALSEADKNRLLLISDPELKQAIDFWAFSFFNYGLNITDIATLKFKDVSRDVIHIPRQKTINTDNSGKMLEIPLREESKEIITRWGNKSLNPNEYVFPILSPGLSASQVKNRINDFTFKLNASLRKAGENLEVPFKLTTYTARHTFASIALEKGASLEFIQIALGHSSMETTVIYTSGFQIKTKRAIGARIYDP